MPDIDTLPAGPELDALIAPFMGWIRVDERIINNISFGPGWWNPAEGDPLDPNPGASCRNPPRYSTDIAAAWRVLERLSELGWSLDLLDRRKTEWAEDKCWWVEANHNVDGYQPEIDCGGDTAPLAICRAALQAVTHAP